MTIIITINQKGLRLDSIQKIVNERIQGQYPEAHISVVRKERPESRADRFSEIQSTVSDAKSDAEELRDELQDWLDNLPENLQQGNKADELETAIGELDEFIDTLDNAENVGVEFPGMY